MLPVSAVYLDDLGLVTIRVGIHPGAAECLGPIGRKPLYMLGVKAVAERMAYHFVRHHPAMPSGGQTAKAVDAARHFEDTLHGFHVAIRPVPKQDALAEAGTGRVEDRPRTSPRIAANGC